MLETIMRYIRNYFPTGNYVERAITIENGTFTLPEFEDGVYIKIEGSTKGNDGVYMYPVYDLRDETFNGAVSQLSPPKEFMELVSEMEQWSEEHKDAVTSPFASESFGGYSYSKTVGASDCLTVFAERLRPWRKI